MNPSKVFAPHALYLAGAVSTCWAVANMARLCLADRLPALLVVLAVFWLSYTLLFLLLVAFLPLNGWLKARPTDGWEKEPVQTAIVLGFGYVQVQSGKMEPGSANQELLEWTLAHTQATTILVQEGVWAAAHDPDVRKRIRPEVQIMRIHAHSRDLYLNTLDTAFCAMQAMERLGEKEAILVTHPMQLARAAWDFETVRRSRESGQNVRFVIPEMPDISYPADSVHPQTRSRWAWQIVELLVSRPRDFLSPVPDHCKAPVPEP